MRRDGGRRARPGREVKRPKQEKRPAESRLVTVPRFGEIPLVRALWTSPTGETREIWEYDPGFPEVLPPGAVRGNIKEQVYCCDVPHFFYLDRPSRCVQCGSDFVFTAGEQKFWYETMKFNFASTAIRCRPCRKKRRSDKALQQSLALARQALDEAPDDPARLLAYAEAMAAYHERFGQGDLSRAIAAARQALKRAPDAIEAIYWEGICQLLTGRKDRARDRFGVFRERAAGAGRYGAMLREIARRLGESNVTST